LKEELSAVQKNHPKEEEVEKATAESKDEIENAHVESQEVSQATEQTNEDKSFDKVWQQILDSAEALGPRINQAIQAANPEILSRNTIKIHITLDSHKELYDKHKGSIYDVLVAELGIKDLKFEWELVKSELEDKRPLKDAEKYQAMVEENPALKLLKDKFNLDIKK
jgi:hypothetical protein